MRRPLPKFKTLWGTCLLLICGLVFASIALQVGFKSDFSFPTTTGGDGDPSGDKPESKLWFNDGFWWASMWSNSGNAYHIHRLDLSTQDWVDTGTPIDTRNDTKGDALWDDANDKLYIVSHVYVSNASTTAPSGQRGQLYRYSYNFATNTYTLDGGFPVEVNDSKSESLVLEKDSTGRLWVTYPRNQQVVVNHSDTDGLTWGTPFVLPTANVNTDDLSSIVAFGTNIGVLWSDQGDDTMYFSVHPDSAAPASGWSSGVAAGGGPGTNFADDHISLKALPPSDPAGTIMAVTKTSETNPRVMLLVC